MAHTHSRCRSNGALRERRLCQVQELRVETTEDGKRYFTGLAAPYNSLSEDLGGWRERIMPGAFSKAIADKQEIHHLINHDENMLLGNTAAGTTEVWETEQGLRFKTLAGTRSYERDLIDSIERGDISKCSFGFQVRPGGQSWTDGPDPEDTGRTIDIRELRSVNVFDVSIVGWPAYRATSAELSSRDRGVGQDRKRSFMFPEGVPSEIRARVEPANLKPIPEPDEDDSACDCSCESCLAGTCESCSNTECEDVHCIDCPQQASMSNVKRGPGYKATAAIVNNAIRMLSAAPSERQEVRSASTSEDGVLALFIYEDIGYDECLGTGVSALGIKEQIEEAGDHSKIRLRINSMGGDVFEAVAIHNLVRGQGKPVEVFVDGMAASAASVIAMAGDVITMGSGSMMMIHNASTGVHGYASDLRKEALVLDKVSGAIARTYVKVTGKSMAFIKGLMDSETWMDAADCVANGFATSEADADDPDTEDRMTRAVRSSRFAVSYRNLPHRFRETRNRTKTVEGERLCPDAFLIIGDLRDSKTWKLPFQFTDEAKTERHLGNNLRRFNAIQGIDPIAKKAAWDKLVKLCKEHDIDVSAESSLRSHLTEDQVYDFEKDYMLTQAAARVRAIQASL